MYLTIDEIDYSRRDLEEAMDLLQSWFHGGEPVNETERFLASKEHVYMSGEKCGAEENEDTGPCELPKGHRSRYHRVTYKNKKSGKREVWAEWSG